MDTWVDSRWFQRTLEIIPGVVVWSVIAFPIIFAFILPKAVAYFILIFNLYWLIKAFNIARHLVNGTAYMKNYMKTDWYVRAKFASRDIKGFLRHLEEENKKSPNRYLKKEIKEISNLEGDQKKVKRLEDIVHVIIIAISNESLDIVEPTIEALYKANYPLDKLLVVLAGEDRKKEDFQKVVKGINARYKDSFMALKTYIHVDKEGEVIGKGANITSAGRLIWKDLERSKVNPENVLVTTLDADHIVHREYFSRLSYKYIIDSDRNSKTYQPVSLLFNNIWDSPAPNRVAATAASFWILMESMRPFRLKTFAAHTQSLRTLLVTDFWSTTTIVEDGHQYFRTYFAFNGNIEMVPLFLPVYQDSVLDETAWKTFKSQYKQRRRWAWGISDFPYIIKSFIKHPEIPFTEKFIQTFRQYSAHFSQGAASLLLATAWIPLLFNDKFMDSVLAHNVTRYSSILINIAWLGVFFSVWTYLALLPRKPESHSNLKYFGMFTQWIFTPPVAIILGSFPSLDAQTRLMLGKYLGFNVTPKVRKSKVVID